jgi:serine/threonine protein kinase
MSIAGPFNVIYFPEGAGYLLVKVLQTTLDDPEIESNVMLVKSLEDNKLYIRKTVELTDCSETGIPNEIEFNPSFELVPHVKDVTKYVDAPSGDYYWAVCTEFCNGGDMRELMDIYCEDGYSTMPEILIWKFIADFCKILKFLSENKIQHKDIWPQNIFLRYSDEDPDDYLPDFVLGDFGWAVPLTAPNQAEDIALFTSRLWEMCAGHSWDGDDFEADEPSHLSWDLRERVNMMVVAADGDYLSLNYLKGELLPHAEATIRKLRTQQVPIQRYLSDLPSTCRTDMGQDWPDGVESLVEDWQLASIKENPDGSGRISLQGLPRTSLLEKRNYLSFICCTPNPVDLDFVPRFDAGTATYPSFTFTHDTGITTSHVGVKALRRADKSINPLAKVNKAMTSDYLRKRPAAPPSPFDNPLPMKRTRLDKEPLSGHVAKVQLSDFNTPYYTSGNVFVPFRDERAKIDPQLEENPTPVREFSHRLSPIPPCEPKTPSNAPPPSPSAEDWSRLQEIPPNDNPYYSLPDSLTCSAVGVEAEITPTAVPDFASPISPVSPGEATPLSSSSPPLIDTVGDWSRFSRISLSHEPYPLYHAFSRRGENVDIDADADADADVDVEMAVSPTTMFDDILLSPVSPISPWTPTPLRTHPQPPPPPLSIEKVSNWSRLSRISPSHDPYPLSCAFWRSGEDRDVDMDIDVDVEMAVSPTTMFDDIPLSPVSPISLRTPASPSTSPPPPPPISKVSNWSRISRVPVDHCPFSLPEAGRRSGVGVGVGVGVDVDVEMGSGGGMEREMNRARVRGADDGYPREAEAAGRRRDWAVWGYCLALFAGMLVLVVVWGLLMR